MMPAAVLDTTHEHDDKAISIIRYTATDGVHSHVHRLHSSLTANGGPADHPVVAAGQFYATPTDAYEELFNWFRLIAAIYPSSVTLSGLDIAPVSTTGPVQPGAPIQSITQVGTGGGASAGPATQLTLTFRDTQNAPCKATFFGVAAGQWLPNNRPRLLSDQAAVGEGAIAYYLTRQNVAGSGGTLTNPITTIVSRNGQAFAIPLYAVSTLNNRLRRSYKLR